MRILLLADIASVHTEKWALGLAKKGCQVGLFSFNNPHFEWFKGVENIEVLYMPKPITKPKTILSKLSYFKYIRELKQKVKTFKPDILHAHYASSYGFFGAKSNFHPFVLSVWGTDIIKFPYQNAFNKKIITSNLKKANLICATSKTIEYYVQKLITKPVTIIPFGIDFNVFKPDEKPKNKDKFVIGAVKSLEKIYNLHILIEAFAIIKAKYSYTELIIVGDGKEREALKALVKQLNIENSVVFTGRVAINQIPDYLNKLNCFVNISEYESFGVSVVEAMACKIPVIVSKTGGLLEIVENNSFGKLVEVGNVMETANAIEELILDKAKAKTIIDNAYNKVKQRYNWDYNLNQQIEAYQKILTN